MGHLLRFFRYQRFPENLGIFFLLGMTIKLCSVTISGISGLVVSADHRDTRREARPQEVVPSICLPRQRAELERIIRT